MLTPIRQTENQAAKPTTTNGSFFSGSSSLPFFQAKLTVNQPGDAQEQEADRVADQVMRMRTGDAPIVQRMPVTPVGIVMRKCAGCEEKEKEGVQRKETGGGDSSGKAAPSVVSDVLSSGGGQRMKGGTLQFMENRFGQDFSQVRIHTDSRAAESASAIQARAYTSGRDVVFGAGEYQPESEGGRRLLAHELVHVGQQDREVQRMVQRVVCANGDAESRLDHGPFLRLIGQYEQEGRISSTEAANYIARSEAPEPARLGRRQRCAIVRDVRSRPMQSASTTPSIGSPTTATITPGGGAFSLNASNYRAILNNHFRGDALAERVVQDMLEAHETLNFADESKLVQEVQKRVRTSRAMQESQDGRRVHGRHATAFGYPFNTPANHYGPRVNYHAREYWMPTVVDNYAARTDRTRIRQMAALPRNRRHEIYGDPAGSYSWSLTAEGQRDPFHATMNLFTPQSQPYKKSLIHCDYLISMVQMRAFIESITPAEFNRRVAAFGPGRFILQWNAFDSLREFYDDPTTPARERGFGSTQVVTLMSESDFLIGDHIYFYNHEAYGVLNENIGNAWQLENAILVDRRRGQDIFLGHGSGRKTKQQMLSKLAEEYNDVADRAIRLSQRVDRNQTGASDEIIARFPNLGRVNGRWRIIGHTRSDFGDRDINIELRRIRPDEVLGLKDPNDISRLRSIRRPIESR